MVTTNTPDFGLRKQDKGDTDWHIPLNNNVDDLDDLLPIVDTYANRSNYTPADGQPYLAYDIGLWLRYDAGGSSWVTVDQLGTGANPVEDVIANGVALTDDSQLIFGSDDDFAIVYDSTEDRLEFVDLVNSTVAYLPRSASGEITGGGSGTADSTSLGTNGDIVYIADGTSGTIDVSTTSTPVQDAIDAIGRSNPGKIILPAGEIQEDGPVQGGRLKTIIGQGINNTDWKCVTDTDFLTQDSTVSGRDWEQSLLWNMRILGGETEVGGRTQGSAVSFTDISPRGFNIAYVTFADWQGPDPVLDFVESPFDCAWPWVKTRNNEAGTGGGGGDAYLINFDGGQAGTGIWIGKLLQAPTTNSNALAVNNGTRLVISEWQVENTAAKMLDNNQSGMGQVHIGSAMYESQNGDATAGLGTGALLKHSLGGRLTIDEFYFKAGTANWILQEAGGGSVRFGSFDIDTGSATLNNSVWKQHSDTTAPQYYFGKAGDVDNTTGSTLTEPVVCFGDVTAKVSTGTGYDGGTDDTRLTDISGGTSVDSTGVIYR